VTPYKLAQAEVGTFEWGDGSNPKVLAYFKDAGHGNISDDAVPWCAAFVGAMLERCGISGTGKLNARSYLDWGVPVELENARPGDVVIFKRGNSTWQGHVAFYVDQNGSSIKVLGGNQSDAVNVKPYSKAKLLGIRRAKGQGLNGPATKPKSDIISLFITFILNMLKGSKK
jgi:uncharacterized protein (TIGR02594 family)